MAGRSTSSSSISDPSSSSSVKKRSSPSPPRPAVPPSAGMARASSEKQSAEMPLKKKFGRAFSELSPLNPKVAAANQPTKGTAAGGHLHHSHHQHHIFGNWSLFRHGRPNSIQVEWNGTCSKWRWFKVKCYTESYRISGELGSKVAELCKYVQRDIGEEYLIWMSISSRLSF